MLAWCVSLSMVELFLFVSLLFFHGTFVIVEACWLDVYGKADRVKVEFRRQISNEMSQIFSFLRVKCVDEVELDFELGNDIHQLPAMCL